VREFRENQAAPRQTGDVSYKSSPVPALPDIILTKVEKERIKKARQRAKAG
jgi:hypothetical protein